MSVESTEVGGRYAKYVLFVLVVVYVFNFIDRQILSILAEDIKGDLGITSSSSAIRRLKRQCRLQKSLQSCAS